MLNDTCWWINKLILRSHLNNVFSRCSNFKRRRKWLTKWINKCLFILLCYSRHFDSSNIKIKTDLTHFLQLLDKPVIAVKGLLFHKLWIEVVLIYVHCCYTVAKVCMNGGPYPLYISFKPEDYEQALIDLNEDLESIVQWSNANTLALNPTKTKYMLFGTVNQISQIKPCAGNLTIMGQPIERVYEARNLGLTIDTELRFHKHVIECIRNCYYRLKILYKARPYLSEELRVLLVVFGFVKIELCGYSVWSTASV